jgi:hypothetical protein
MIQKLPYFEYVWIDFHDPPEVMPMSPPPFPWSFLIMYRTWGGWGRCSKAKNSGQWQKRDPMPMCPNSRIIVQAVSRAQLRLWSASRPIRVKTSEAWLMAWPNCSWSARWGPGGSWWHVSVMSKSAWSGCGGGLSASSDSMFPLGSTNWLEISITTTN